MSSVSQVASSGEVSSLELFGCRTDSPPMSSEHLTLPAPSLGDASVSSLALVPRNPLVGPPSVDAVPSDRRANSDTGPVKAAVEVRVKPASTSVSAKSGQAKLTPAAVKGGKYLPFGPPAKPQGDTTHETGLHRIAKIREQQGITERTMARRLGVDVKRYRQLEDPHCDLSLTQLIAIQAALEVPIGDLLEDRQGLSRPVEERAKMLKIMKTAVALKEAKISARADRMAQMLCEQLVELMPELAEVSGWPQFGARRGASAVGKALQQPIDTSNILYQE